ncbi:MAG: hypothetical protein AB8B45_03910 [Prochlorococcus sp.]
MPTSPVAREEVSINGAWTAVAAHVPTILVIWLVSIAIAFIALIFSRLTLGIFSAALYDYESGPVISILISQVSSLPFNIVTQLLSVLFVAVPALYYAFGDVVTPGGAFGALFSRPMRYIGAGILFSIASLIGTIFCIIPGIAVGLTYPVFVNKIFTTDIPIMDAFSSSFSALYKSEAGWSFVGIQILAFICVFLTSVCTCGLGALIAIPIGTFYIQHAAYNKGVVS